MRFPTRTVLAFALASSLPVTAAADRCSDFATAATFDQHTAAWNLARAESYARSGARYVETTDPKCASYRGVERRESFEPGERRSGAKPVLATAGVS